MVNTDDMNDSIIEFSTSIADAERPEPLPVGEYLAEIRDAKRKISAKTNNSYVQITYFVRPDQYPADYVDGNADGTSIMTYGFSVEDNPRAKWGVRDFFEKIDLDPPDRRLDLSQLLNHPVKLSITHEPYEGVMQARVSRVQRAN